MFDIGWGELVVIGVVALVAIGPKELPGTLRTLGQWMGKVRRMAADFQHQFNEAMREAEMADLKKQVDNLTSGFDPIETARREIEGAFDDKPKPPPSTEPSVAPVDLQVPPPEPAPAPEAEKALTGDVPAVAPEGAGAAKPGDPPA